MRLNMLLIIQQICSWWLPEEGFLPCQLETIQTIYVKFWYGQKTVFQNNARKLSRNLHMSTCIILRMYKFSNCRANRPFMHLKSSLRFKVKEVTTTWIWQFWIFSKKYLPKIIPYEKNIVRTIFLKFALTLLIIAGGVAVFVSLLATAPAVKPKPSLEKIWPVKTITLDFSDIRPDIREFGTVVAGNQAELRPLVPGRVV